jgi:mersacidin/lichenicidin family type 2 lantibiotic
MTAALLDRPKESEFVDTLRAWMDPDYRDTLSAEQLESLAPSPIGDLQLVETYEIVASSTAWSAVFGTTCAFSLGCTGWCCLQ